MIAVAKNSRKNERLLAKENADKTAMTEVAKVLSIINLGNKYS